MTSTYSPKNMPRRMAEDGERDANRYENLVLAVSRRAERIVQEHGKRLQQFWADAADAYGRMAAAAKDGGLADDAKAYATDAAQRGALMLDILRERADKDVAHEAAGTPPVLIYDYDVILDGKTLSRPSNKVLLRIRSPEGVEVDERKRPYMIFEPRSGLGAGIGSFKPKWEEDCRRFFFLTWATASTTGPIWSRVSNWPTRATTTSASITMSSPRRRGSARASSSSKSGGAATNSS